MTVSNNGEVSLRSVLYGKDVATKRQNEILDDGSEYLIYSRLGLHTGAIGYIPFGLVDSIVSTDFPVFKSIENIRFLAYILQSKIFVDKIIEKNPTGAAQQRFHQNDFLDIEIPLPTSEEQASIVTKIEKEKEIIQGINKILSNWCLTEADFFKNDILYNEIPIDDFAKIGTGSTPSREVKEYFDGEINWVLTGEVQMNEIFKTSEKLSKKAIEDYGLKIYPKNTVLIAMYGQGKTRGQSSIIRIPAAITQNCAGITCNEEVVLPEYVWYYLMAIYEKIRGQDYSGGGVPHLNLKIAKNIKIPIPIMSRQKEIVSELSQKVKLLQDLRKMKTEAKRRINKILTDVWGVEYIETKTQEIEE